MNELSILIINTCLVVKQALISEVLNDRNGGLSEGCADKLLDLRRTDLKDVVPLESVQPFQFQKIPTFRFWRPAAPCLLWDALGRNWQHITPAATVSGRFTFVAEKMLL